MLENIKNLCNSFLEAGLPGFDIVVYKDGECVLRHMGGYSDAEKKIPMTGKERYYIYSCSKPITCVSAMMLWEQGLFSLEDKLCDYMPEFANMRVLKDGVETDAQNPILIKHLFSMSAGLTYDLFSPSLKAAREETGGRCPTRETIKYLAKEPLVFEPGERWNYSLCHDVLAALVEVISGKRFENFVKENVFDPLGMKDSTFILPECEKDQIAAQYWFNPESKKAEPFDRNDFILGSEYASGGAGCVSTVNDYIKFLEALRKGELIKQETIDRMLENTITKEGEQYYWISHTYGYGLGLRIPKEGGLHRDFGWDGAAGAYLAVDREHGITVYYAQHMLATPPEIQRDRLYPYIMADIVGDEAFKKITGEY